MLEMCVLGQNTVALFTISCFPVGIYIESSPVCDTSWRTGLIYDLFNKYFLCGTCPKPLTIQYLLPDVDHCSYSASSQLNPSRVGFPICT